MNGKDPMRPKDPNDIFPGYWYAVYVLWKPSRSQEADQLFAGAREERDVLSYEGTLADAQLTLDLQARSAESRYNIGLHKTSKNRWYGSEPNEFSVELYVDAVEAPSGSVEAEIVS